MNVRPDPTFHASPKLAMQAPVENFAFTVMLSPDGSQSDGIAVVGIDFYRQLEIALGVLPVSFTDVLTGQFHPALQRLFG